MFNKVEYHSSMCFQLGGTLDIVCVVKRCFLRPTLWSFVANSAELEFCLNQFDTSFVKPMKIFKHFWRNVLNIKYSIKIFFFLFKRILKGTLPWKISIYSWNLLALFTLPSFASSVCACVQIKTNFRWQFQKVGYLLKDFMDQIQWVVKLWKVKLDMVVVIPKLMVKLAQTWNFVVCAHSVRMEH